jgi:hypothetical protein
VASVLTCVAMLLTWVASFACSFFEADDLGVGLWTVEDAFLDKDTCYGWNEVDRMKERLDTPLTFARVMSLSACLSSPIVFVIILLPSCVTMPRSVVKALVIFMFFLSFSIMLCLVSRGCSIRAFTLVSWSFSDINSRMISGGSGFGYLPYGK